MIRQGAGAVKRQHKGPLPQGLDELIETLRGDRADTNGEVAEPLNLLERDLHPGKRGELIRGLPHGQAALEEAALFLNDRFRRFEYRTGPPGDQSSVRGSGFCSRGALIAHPQKTGERLEPDFQLGGFLLLGARPRGIPLFGNELNAAGESQ